MQAITGQNITLKGAVGRFAYGYTGPQAWVVVMKDTRSICATGRNLSDVFKLASRFHNEEKAEG